MNELLVNSSRTLDSDGMDGSGIGGFIRQRRNELGIVQRDLAERAGVSKGYLSTLESNKIGLPAPDVRRRLAKALGVSHVRLLEAANEITAAELADAGVVGVVEQELSARAKYLIELVRAADWDHPTVGYFFTATESLLLGMLERQGRTPPPADRTLDDA